jgi:hypothetical protein
MPTRYGEVRHWDSRASNALDFISKNIFHAFGILYRFKNFISSLECVKSRNQVWSSKTEEDKSLIRISVLLTRERVKQKITAEHKIENLGDKHRSRKENLYNLLQMVHTWCIK